MKDKIPKFKHCTVCGAKINFLRRMIARKQDRKGEFHLTQRQFCSPRCAKIGIKIIAELSQVKDDERQRIVTLIEEQVNKIVIKRQNEVQRYGSVNNIPSEVMKHLYPGTLQVLDEIKRGIYEDEKKRNQFSSTEGYQ